MRCLSAELGKGSERGDNNINVFWKTVTTAVSGKHYSKGFTCAHSLNSHNNPCKIITDISMMWSIKTRHREVKLFVQVAQVQSGQHWNSNLRQSGFRYVLFKLLGKISWKEKKTQCIWKCLLKSFSSIFPCFKNHQQYKTSCLFIISFLHPHSVFNVEKEVSLRLIEVTDTSYCSSGICIRNFHFNSDEGCS